MISASDRHAAVELINEVMASGAHQNLARAEPGITARTLQRWSDGEAVRVDGGKPVSHLQVSSRLSERIRQPRCGTCPGGALSAGTTTRTSIAT